MMDDLYKFGWLPNGQEEEPYQYPDVWVRESSDRMDRLAIAPRSGYVNLLADLASVLEEPFLLLYVLVVPRGQAEPGRYQPSTDSARPADSFSVYSLFSRTMLVTIFGFGRLQAKGYWSMTGITLSMRTDQSKSSIRCAE